MIILICVSLIEFTVNSCLNTYEVLYNIAVICCFTYVGRLSFVKGRGLLFYFFMAALGWLNTDFSCLLSMLSTTSINGKAYLYR